jgi:hypothetical protein
MKTPVPALALNTGLLAGALACLFIPTEATATERHFTYTYGSAVLNRGDVEVEPWTTLRVERSGFYARFDQRLEVEVGLAERLQSSWYLNLTAINQEIEGARASKFEFAGVSSEWKYKLADPVADPFGAALYGELTAGPSESELEAKLILDKHLGALVAAFNLTAEHEWIYESAETEREFVLELDGGLACFLSPALTAGLEIRSHSDWESAEGWGMQHSALFAGPALSYAQPAWWAALTILPQIAAIEGATDGGLVLDGHERVEARLIFGVHLQ